MRISSKKRNENMSKDDNILELLKKVKFNFGISGTEENIWGKLTKEEQNSFLESAHKIFSEPALKFVSDLLINKQAEDIMTKEISDNEIMFNRATVNGILLLYKELNNMSEIYLSSKKVDQDYNKYNVI